MQKEGETKPTRRCTRAEMCVYITKCEHKHDGKFTTLCGFYYTQIDGFGLAYVCGLRTQYDLATRIEICVTCPLTRRTINYILMIVFQSQCLIA